MLCEGILVLTTVDPHSKRKNKHKNHHREVEGQAQLQNMTLERVGIQSLAKGHFSKEDACPHRGLGLLSFCLLLMSSSFPYPDDTNIAALLQT